LIILGLFVYVQKACARRTKLVRLASATPRRAKSTVVLACLQWLPIIPKILYKIVMLTFMTHSTSIPSHPSLCAHRSSSFWCYKQASRVKTKVGILRLCSRCSSTKLYRIAGGMIVGLQFAKRPSELVLKHPLLNNTFKCRVTCEV